MAGSRRIRRRNRLASMVDRQAASGRAFDLVPQARSAGVFILRVAAGVGPASRGGRQAVFVPVRVAESARRTAKGGWRSGWRESGVSASRPGGSADPDRCAGRSGFSQCGQPGFGS